MILAIIIFLFVSFFPFIASPASINLSWKDNSTNEQGFKIERRIGNKNNGQFEKLYTVPQNVTTIDMPVNLYGIRHCYRIISYNEAGEAKPSNTKCIIIYVQ
jgi:hypothetical protein